MRGLSDRSGMYPLRMFTHVRITHPNHSYYSQTGTVVRIDVTKRKVWVALPGGTVTPAGHRSVEVVISNSPRQKNRNRNAR